MEVGDCEVFGAGNCAATCAAQPPTARCAGWVRLGHCEAASPFMLVHCPNSCPREQVQCMRPPPKDLTPQCPQWAAQGHCEEQWRRGNGYFLAQCFVSCGRRDARMVLNALLTLGNSSAFPDAPSTVRLVASDPHR